MCLPKRKYSIYRGRSPGIDTQLLHSPSMCMHWYGSSAPNSLRHFPKYTTCLSILAEKVQTYVYKSGSESGRGGSVWDHIVSG